MEKIKQQAELYAESFRYKIDDAGWYEQKVRDFIAGYEAALRIHNVISSVCGKPCDELRTACDKCKADYYKWAGSQPQTDL